MCVSVCFCFYMDNWTGRSSISILCLTGYFVVSCPCCGLSQPITADFQHFVTQHKSFAQQKKYCVLFRQPQTPQRPWTALAELDKQIETTSIFSASRIRATITFNLWLRKGAVHCVKKSTQAVAAPQNVAVAAATILCVTECWKPRVAELALHVACVPVILLISTV